MQSTPKHVAIIMDGNRRWAKERGLADAAGHREGMEALVRLLPSVANSGVEVLTVFGFSSANWRRCDAEVSHLLRMAEEALRRFAPLCIRRQVAVTVIGRRDRLPDPLVRGVRRLEEATARGARQLRIAIDYSSREAIVQAALAMTTTTTTATGKGRDCGYDAGTLSKVLSPVGDVDFLIRTGKEQRLSDFLLWECAFAELYFPDLYWPDFDTNAFEAALAWYGRRHRTFGA